MTGSIQGDFVSTCPFSINTWFLSIEVRVDKDLNQPINFFFGLIATECARFYST